MKNQGQLRLPCVQMQGNTDPPLLGVPKHQKAMGKSENARGNQLKNLFQPRHRKMSTWYRSTVFQHK